MASDPPAGAAPARPPAPPGFWVIWSTVAIDQIVFAMVLPVLPFVARRYGADPIQVTSLVAVFAVAQFLLSPLVGALSDRIGRKPVLVVSLLGSAVGSVILGLAGSLLWLFVGRAIDGMSGTALVSAQSAVTDLVEPRQRARYLGLMGSAFAVGFIVGPALTGLTARWDQRLPFFIAAGLAAANALAAVVRLPETRSVRDRAESHVGGGDRSPFSVFRRSDAITPAAWFYIGVLVLGLLAFSAVEGGAFTLLGHDRFGLTESSTAFVFMGIGLVLAVVQVRFVGPVNDRLGTRRTVVVSMLVNAVGFALLAAADHLWLLLVGVACNAVGQGLLRPTGTAAVSNAVPAQHRGAAIGTQTGAQGLVRIVGPLEAGWAYQAIGTAAPFVVGAGLSLAAAGLAAGPGRRYDGDVTAPTAPATPANSERLNPHGVTRRSEL